jgi:hypothetical protein
MINPVKIIRRASFVPDWRFMGLTALLGGVLGLIIVSASQSDTLLTKDAVCTVKEITATGRNEISLELGCKSGERVINTSTRSALTVLAVVNAHAREVVCDVYADQTPKDCRVPE